MSAIRFETSGSEFTASLNKKINAYFAQNQLSRKGNWQSAIKIVLMLVLYFGPFLLILAEPLPKWSLIPLAITMGVGMAGIGMGVMHDAAHGALSSHPWINRLFSRSIYLMGSSSLTWNIQHNYLHHNYTNIFGKDEDIGGRSVLRFSPKVPFKKIHRFQHYYALFLYSLLTLSKLPNDFVQLSQYNKKGLTRRQNKRPRIEMVRLAVLKAVYVAVAFGLPLALTDLGFLQVLIGFVIMHCVGGFIMAIVFQLAHVVDEVQQPSPNASGVIEEEWMAHQLRTTANFAPKNRLLGWYVGGLNFQVEHHLFPKISHVHYAKLSPIVETTAREFGISYHQHTTLADAVASHRKVLKDLGRP